jgi:hypothetical protein
MATTLRRLDGLPSAPFGLYHDAQNLVITTHSVVLTVQESYHLLVDVGCDLYISNLFVNDGLHDHVSNHLVLGQDVFLAVQEAYHLHRGDSTYAGVTYLISTDPSYPLELPSIELSGSFGERGASVEGGMYLPGISVESRAGSHMVADLPVMEGIATGTQDMPMAVDANLPIISISSRAGIRGGTMQLPTMEIAASTEAVYRCSLDRLLPGFTILATARETNLSYLDADLPALQASITIDAEIWASLDSIISPPILSATMSVEAEMNMDGLLPALMVVSDLGGTSMSVVGYIPPPVMVYAGEGVGAAVLEDTTRFDDLVLRYARE